MIEKRTADVIIIGGGIMGCSTAYRLAKLGLDVLVLEKKEIGNGGSCRNAGGVRQSARDPKELQLAMYAVANIWPTLSEELGVNVEYHQKGNIRLGLTEKDVKVLENHTAKSTKVGLDVKMISGDEAREICPYMSEEIIAASWCPTDGHANPMVTTLAFYKKARENGVRFITGEKVEKLRKVKGRLREVYTKENLYEGEYVVVAAGYESREILATIGVDVPMHKELCECLVTEAEPHMFNQMLGTAEADFYGHQADHGSFVFGGMSGMELNNKDIGPKNSPSNSAITAPCICRGIMKYFPALADAKIVRTWAGYLDICQDGVPVLGFVDEVPGLVVACAFSGHGFGIAPAVGEQMAMLIDEGHTTVDISGLRYGRFKAKI